MENYLIIALVWLWLWAGVKIAVDNWFYSGHPAWLTVSLVFFWPVLTPLATIVEAVIWLVQKYRHG